MNIVGVIPARWASSRLPGKPLADLCGKPVIQHTYEQCRKATSLSRIIVATDDERILNTVRGFGGEAVMTGTEHPNGTSRVAEVVKDIDCDYVINIQGDEPMIDPRMIDQLCEVLIASPSPMATLSCQFTSDEEANDPNNVKVVAAIDGKALYFSRSLIPYARNGKPPVFKHIGSPFIWIRNQILFVNKFLSRCIQYCFYKTEIVTTIFFIKRVNIFYFFHIDRCYSSYNTVTFVKHKSIIIISY